MAERDFIFGFCVGGVIDVPSVDPIFDKAGRAEAQTPGSVVARLQEVDPESLESIARNNVRQQIRALEIFEMTGRKASDLKREHGFKDEEVPMRAYWLQWPAEPLRQRIRARVDVMLDAGFVQEVKGLLESGVTMDCQAMRAVGYREVGNTCRESSLWMNWPKEWKSTWVTHVASEPGYGGRSS